MRNGPARPCGTTTARCHRGGVQRVDQAIVVADDDQAIGDRQSGVDRRPDVVLPADATGCKVDRRHEPAFVADIDDPIFDDRCAAGDRTLHPGLPLDAQRDDGPRPGHDRGARRAAAVGRHGRQARRVGPVRPDKEDRPEHREQEEADDRELEHEARPARRRPTDPARTTLCRGIDDRPDAGGEAGRGTDLGRRGQRRADRVVGESHHLAHRRSASSARSRAFRAFDSRHLTVPTGDPVRRPISASGVPST